MNSLYPLAGISKQAHFKAVMVQSQRLAQVERVTDSARQIRAVHPVLGCRKMYRMLAPQLSIGRDKTEAILLGNGFRVRYPRNFIRTTHSVKSNYFDNRISGRTIDGINQLWQSDITYFIAGGSTYYLTFITDVYSKRILGYQANTHMLATANVAALRQALRCRGHLCSQTLIHHSDRGGQYIDKQYISLQRQHGIQSSMGKHSWENAYAERVNGIIKNEYLHHMHSPNLRALRCNLSRVVKLYNEKRPHLTLPDKSPPLVYERNLATNADMRYTMTIYDSALSTNPQIATKKKVAKKKRNNNHNNH